MTRAMTRATTAAPADSSVDHANDVHLVGRVAATPVERTLPSGDVLIQWRLIVDRAGGERTGRTVDVLACAAWTAKVRRSVRSWNPGDVVEVDGALRRRFWRAPTGTANRYEVEARTVRRLERAPV